MDVCDRRKQNTSIAAKSVGRAPSSCNSGSAYSRIASEPMEEHADQGHFHPKASMIRRGDGVRGVCTGSIRHEASFADDQVDAEDDGRLSDVAVEFSDGDDDNPCLHWRRFPFNVTIFRRQWFDRMTPRIRFKLHCQVMMESLIGFEPPMRGNAESEALLKLIQSAEMGKGLITLDGGFDCRNKVGEGFMFTRSKHKMRLNGTKLKNYGNGEISANKALWMWNALNRESIMEKRVAAFSRFAPLATLQDTEYFSTGDSVWWSADASTSPLTTRGPCSESFSLWGRFLTFLRSVITAPPPPSFDLDSDDDDVYGPLCMCRSASVTRPNLVVAGFLRARMRSLDMFPFGSTRHFSSVGDYQRSNRQPQRSSVNLRRRKHFNTPSWECTGVEIQHDSAPKRFCFEERRIHVMSNDCENRRQSQWPTPYMHLEDNNTVNDTMDKGAVPVFHLPRRLRDNDEIFLLSECYNLYEPSRIFRKPAEDATCADAECNTQLVKRSFIDSLGRPRGCNSLNFDAVDESSHAAEFCSSRLGSATTVRSVDNTVSADRIAQSILIDEKKARVDNGIHTARHGGGLLAQQSTGLRSWGSKASLQVVLVDLETLCQSGLDEPYCSKVDDAAKILRNSCGHVPMRMRGSLGNVDMRKWNFCAGENNGDDGACCICISPSFRESLPYCHFSDGYLDSATRSKSCDCKGRDSGTSTPALCFLEKQSDDYDELILMNPSIAVSDARNECTDEVCSKTNGRPLATTRKNYDASVDSLHALATMVTEMVPYCSV